MTLEQVVEGVRRGELVVVPVTCELADELRAGAALEHLELVPHDDDPRVCDFVVRSAA